LQQSQNVLIFSAYTDAITSSCKIVAAFDLLSSFNEHDKMQLFIKFKNILWRGFSATLNFALTGLTGCIDAMVTCYRKGMTATS